MDRPVGIKILSPLHAIGGMVLLFKVAFGAPNILAVILLVYLGLLALSSAIGMWLGKRWGWWLGAFFYTHTIIRHIHYLNDIQAMAQYAHVTTGYLYGLLAVKVLGSLLVLGYFFRRSVVNSFQFQKFSKPRAIAILVGISLLVGSF